MTDSPRPNFALNGPSITLDPKTHAVRGDLADLALAGKLFVPHYARPMAFNACADGTAVHAEAEPQSEVVATLKKGDTFMVVDLSGGWAWGFVKDSHLVGYVPATALTQSA
jgi:hypothetical protein